MSFKLKKLKLDLELDLTVYIPGEVGVINPVKTSPEDLFDWMKHCTKVGTEAFSLKDDKEKTDEEKLVLTRNQLISQIDFLYEKGESYWRAIPFSLLTDIISYITAEVKKTEKK